MIPAAAIGSISTTNPNMALNMTTGVLDPRVTFARTSTGTYFNSGGLLATANSGTPRFSYDPLTLVPQGLLIEESRTNSVVYSNDFMQSGWFRDHCSIIPNAAISPDGTINASLLYPISSGPVFGQLYRTCNINGPLSVFVKFAGRRWLCVTDVTGVTGAVWFDLQNGVVGTVTATYSATIQKLPNNWYRCSVVPPSSWSYFDILSTDADNTNTVTASGQNGIYVYGAQIEPGAFPTSYIPTQASTVTRAADNASMTGTNFSSWYNQTQGTFVCSAFIGTGGNANYIPQADDGSNANRILNDITLSANHQYVIVGSSTVGDNLLANATVNTINTVANTYKVGSFVSSLNGGAVVTSAPGSLPTLTTARIGTNNASAYSTCAVKGISYYPVFSPSARVQALSKG